MVFLNSFFLLALPLLLFLILRSQKYGRKSCRPPGPRGLPLIGNLHHLANSAPQVHLWNLSQKYGPIMSLRVGQVPMVVISSARLAKEVLKTQDAITCTRPLLLGQQKLSYNGSDIAFAPYNDCWREIRKICIVHLFSSVRVQSFRPVRQEEIGRMIEKVSKAAKTSRPANITAAMMSYTSTLICRIAFGKAYEDEGVERSRFQSLLNETQAIFTSFFVSDYFPLLGFVDKLTGMISRLEKNFNEFDAFYQEIINEHLDPNRPNHDDEDILDVLLQIRKNRSFKFDLKFDHIKAILMNVFVAGTDTSAASVVWAMTYLMKNPRAMKKVQDEIRKTVGKKGVVQEDDIEELAYLKAVVKETLRIQPTVPLLIPRETTEKCNIGGYELEPKTRVHINTYAIGRDAEVWEKADEFRPERFIGSAIDLKGQDFELTPFGGGRRICPGMFMGLANLEAALANLLYKFDWEMPDGMKADEIDMGLLPGITMHKKVPLCLVPRNYV